MKEMEAQAFADMKGCLKNKVMDAVHGRGKQRLNSYVKNVKGEGRSGSRRRMIILDELAEKFEGGIRAKSKDNIIEQHLKEDRIEWNRPVPRNVYNYQGVIYE